MYIQIGIPTYTRLKNLSYAPEVDVSGASVPINEMSVDIITDDAIDRGMDLFLYDDMDALFCRYTIVYAEQSAPGVMTVRAQSDVAKLDRVTLLATVYDTDTEGVLSDIFGSVAAYYTLDASLSGKTVKGYCPEQSARDRLAWLCLVLGAYVKHCFNEAIEILPVKQAQTLIPYEATYFRPTTVYRDFVTSYTVTAYQFREGEPQTTEEWVKDSGGVTYIVTRTEATAMPPQGAVPAGAVGVAMRTDDVMLVRPGNLSAVLSRLSTYYFNRLEVDLDCINNGEFTPGMRVIGYTGEDSLITGYIQRADFSFGKQARSTLHIVGVAATQSAKLTVTYKYNNTKLGKATYTLPVGYQYSIPNPYLDKTRKKVRRVYRPLTAAAEGTMAQGANAVTVQYDVALELKNGILSVISVDDVEIEVDGENYVGVIS